MASSDEASTRICSFNSPLDKYSFKNVIGYGSYGKVFSAIHRATGEEVAIKIMQNIKKERIEEEVKILQSLKHDNIIKYYESFNVDDKYYVVFEYIKGGELFNILERKGKLPMQKIAKYFYQLVNAIKYMHSKHIYHRDLKPENILMGENETLKIIDFGTAKESNDSDMLRTKCGSLNYCSPEIILGSPYSGPSSDLWSLGVVLFVFGSGSLPFDERNEKLLLRKIFSSHIRFPFDFPDVLKNIVKRLLVVDPQKRASIEEMEETSLYQQGKYLEKNEEEDYKLKPLISERCLKMTEDKMKEKKINDELSKKILYNKIMKEVDWRKELKEEIKKMNLNEINTVNLKRKKTFNSKAQLNRSLIRYKECIASTKQKGLEIKKTHDESKKNLTESVAVLNMKNKRNDDSKHNNYIKSKDDIWVVEKKKSIKDKKKMSKIINNTVNSAISGIRYIFKKIEDSKKNSISSSKFISLNKIQNRDLRSENTTNQKKKRQKIQIKDISEEKKINTIEISFQSNNGNKKHKKSNSGSNFFGHNNKRFDFIISPSLNSSMNKVAIKADNQLNQGLANLSEKVSIDNGNFDKENYRNVIKKLGRNAYQSRREENKKILLRKGKNKPKNNIYKESILKTKKKENNSIRYIISTNKKTLIDDKSTIIEKACKTVENEPIKKMKFDNIFSKARKINIQMNNNNKLKEIDITNLQEKKFKAKKMISHSKNRKRSLEEDNLIQLSSIHLLSQRNSINGKNIKTRKIIPETGHKPRLQTAKIFGFKSP